MTNSHWKNIERKIANFFGSERTPLSGGNSKITRSDSLHDTLFIESKYRKTHSAVSLWRKTKEMADKEGKIPVVALCEKGKPGFFLVIWSNDLQAVSNMRAVARIRGDYES